METNSLQTAFFARVKAAMPAHFSLAEHVAEDLNISTDSAYRRIRGEKPLTFDELAILSRKYKCPIDSLIGIENDDFIFTGKLANTHDHVFEKWLADVLAQFTRMQQHGCQTLYYLAKDLPIAHFFTVPELAAFKFFFWQKAVMQYEELKGEKFSYKYLNGRGGELAAAIAHTYTRIATCEVWNAETINSTLRQIRFYRDAGMFQSKDDLHQLLNAMSKLVDHVEAQAEAGIKFTPGGSPSSAGGEHIMYNNELILGNNTVLADYGGRFVTFLNHSVLNYIATADTRFNEYMHAGIINMLRKSERLDRTNEKGRAIFFNHLRSLVAQVKQESQVA